MTGRGRRAVLGTASILALALFLLLRESGPEGPAPPEGRRSEPAAERAPGTPVPPKEPAPEEPAPAAGEKEGAQPPPPESPSVVVRGLVTDGQGVPLGEAWVWADDAIPRGNGSGARTMRLTGADGRYEMQLPEGKHVLHARGSRTATASAEALLVRGETTVDAPVLVLGEGGVIRGKAVDGAGKPLPFVRVRCFAEEGEAVEIATGEGRLLIGMDDVVTAGDGTFTLRGLERVPHRVLVDRLFLGAGLRVEPEEAKGVLPGGEPLLFRVSGEAAARGVVLDAESGEPVQAFLVNGQPVEAVDGRFEVPCKAGEPLAVEAGGYLPFRREDLALREGEKAEGITVRLEADPEAGSLVVAARGEGGASLPGLLVRGLGPGFRMWRREWKAGGTEFRVRPLAPGKHALFIEAPGHALASVEAEVPARGEARVEVALARSGSVRLRILDGKGNPLRYPGELVLRDEKGAGPAVTLAYTRPQGTAFPVLSMSLLASPEGTSLHLSECDGRLEGLRAGPYTLRVKDGDRTKEVSFQVAGGEEREVTVRIGE